jgi:hypothetical protein
MSTVQPPGARASARWATLRRPASRWAVIGGATLSFQGVPFRRPVIHRPRSTTASVTPLALSCSIDPRLAGPGAPYGAAWDRHVATGRHRDGEGFGRKLLDDIGAGIGAGGRAR